MKNEEGKSDSEAPAPPKAKQIKQTYKTQPWHETKLTLARQCSKDENEDLGKWCPEEAKG